MCISVIRLRVSQMTHFMADASRSEGTELPGVIRYLRESLDNPGMAALWEIQNIIGLLSHVACGKLRYIFSSL